MNSYFFILSLFLLSIIFVQPQDTTYTRYYQQCKKIVSSMTLQQKIGQTLQVDFNALSSTFGQHTDPQQAVSFALGGLAINGDSAPTNDGNMAKIPLEIDKQKQYYLQKTRENWKKIIDRINKLGVQVSLKDKSAKYKIKFFLSTDANHGDQNTLTSVIWPHNIGLSVSHNQKNFQNLGYWTKQSLKKTGFNMANAPNLAVSHNPQWGRYYETIGQQDDWGYKYGKSFVKGLMDVNNGKINGVLGSAKGFFGDGATKYGANQGSASVISFKPFIKHNIPGYAGAITSGLGSVTISHSSINLVPSVYQSYFKLGLLREQLGFTGFTITEYDQIRKVDNQFLPRTFFNVTEEQGYAMIVNGGTDMLLLSGEKVLVQRVIKHAKKAVLRKQLLERRLDESIVRILAVKMAMGLVQKVSGDKENNNNIVTKQQLSINQPSFSKISTQYLDSLSAVHQSLVLLKNSDSFLPISNIKSTIQYIILIGQKIHNLNGLTKIQLFRNFDSIGLQCGGWTIRWQGSEGNDFWDEKIKAVNNASSILDALKIVQKSAKFELIYPQYSSLTNELTINSQRTKFLSDLKTKAKNFNSRNTLIIGTFGQFPYAQTTGDINIPYCKHFDDPGCLYRTSRNPYAPGSQLKTLQVTLSAFQKQVVDTVRLGDKDVGLVSVLISGRPMLVEKLMVESQAVIAAWLPGTSGGQGIVDAIIGDYVFRENGSNDRRNTLSVDWPKTMESLANFPMYLEDDIIPKIDNPLFTVGYGLGTGRQGNRNYYADMQLIREE